MLASEVITDVRFELMEPVPGFWTDAELINQINRAQQDFTNKTRILEDSATMDTEAGRNTYPLPSNWLASKAVFYNLDAPPVSPTQKGWKRLEAFGLEKAAQMTPNFLSDDPSTFADSDRYFIWDKDLVVVPTPKEDGHVIKMFFKCKPPTVNAPTDTLAIDDSLSGMYRAFVLWKAWMKEKELDLAKDQEVRYMQFVREGLRWVKLEAGDRSNQIDVRSPFPYTRGFNGMRYDPLA